MFLSFSDVKRTLDHHLGSGTLMHDGKRWVYHDLSEVNVHGGHGTAYEVPEWWAHRYAVMLHLKFGDNLCPDHGRVWDFLAQDYYEHRVCLPPAAQATPQRFDYDDGFVPCDEELDDAAWEVDPEVPWGRRQEVR